ncbi:MAG TPA: D-alanine--D-alanine ligase [Candidatus Hydrogenedentes bacterium]|nr:D-alanine--D-alanine ligase [Candidatus Hydrogenedentota bacterium]HPG69044.1 D-alanine--D-alanine ligase [Candidatus Hydrogenedentota bacterium]
MNTKRKKVAVLMGGMSSEHEVSMHSGEMVLASLDPDKLDAVPVRISRDGTWAFGDEAPMSIFDAVPRLEALGLDCAFIALHGPFGEDGRLQGMLDLLGIPYTCSGCAASALAMDKIRSKAVVRQLGVRVANHVVVHRTVWNTDRDRVMDKVASKLGFPCVIKSPCQGSSLGMAITREAADFAADIEAVFAFGDEVMIEEFVNGIELTCGVLDLDPGSPPIGLPVTQIIPVTSKFFDYEAKYTPGASREITPAEIPDELAAAVQGIAVRVHQAVGGRIWSRHDFLVAGSDPVWIEINTVPGMTQTSLYPQAAAAAGISYAELMERFIEAAIAFG